MKANQTEFKRNGFSKAVGFTALCVAVVLALRADCGSVAANPAEGATVSLLTDYQKGWLSLSPEDRVKALSEASDAPAAYREIKTADFSYGAPVALAWDGATGEAMVALKKGDEVVETLKTAEASVTVYNLELATEYTWTLAVDGYTSTHSFVTEAQPPRLIRSGTMQFVRDLGGWTGLQGCKVRANEIFRGGPPNENKTTNSASLLDDQAIDFWRNRIGLRSEIDFRGSSEHSSSSPMEGLGASYLKYSIDYYKAYAPSETSSGSGRNYLNTLKAILNAAKRPVYFHCAYGRDRTGTIASLVLAILGVSEEDILKDYHATTIRSGSVYKNGLAQPAYYFDRFASFRSDIRKGYPADTFAESVEKYFIALGISKDEIETFRTDMLVGYVSSVAPEPPEGDDPDVPPEVRYSSDGGITWTDATLVEAVAAANLNDAVIIELCQDVNLPVGSQLAFTRANQEVTIRSRTDSRHTLTRTAAVGGSAEANLKLDASGANLTLENVLIDLGGVKGNIIATISGKSGCCVTLGAGMELFNADMDGSSVIQLIGANSSLTFDGGVIRDITDANMIVYAKQAASLVLAAGGISNCVVSSEQPVVNLAAGGSFVMTGGFVKGNRATDSGGAIVKTGTASVTISGGEIADNVWLDGSYGALYMKGTASFSGNPVIRGNKLNGTTEMNVTVSEGSIQQDGNLHADAYIGVTGSADEGAPFGSLTSAGFTGAEHFHCDGNAELVGTADGTVLKWTKTAVEPTLVWDVPAGAGGISGFEGADGVKVVAFEAVELSATGLKVRFRAGQIDADGETFGLICKTDITSDATIVVNAKLAAEPGATEGVLTVTEDLGAYTRLFVIGICAPVPFRTRLVRAAPPERGRVARCYE